MLNSIFKSYDIRGIYPKEINKETARKIGEAFAAMTGGKKIVVGRDMRLGSPEISAGFMEGLVKMGVAVHDLGLVPIDAVYFAVGKYSYDGGAMITASHNPKSYDGIKLVKKGMEWVRGKDVLEFLENMENMPQGNPRPGGSVTPVNIADAHVSHVLSFTETSKIKSLKIVVDAGNGMAGKMIPPLLQKIPRINYLPLFFELDGNFPNHESNPLESSNRAALVKKVLEEKADLGIIFDGDSDRVFFIDEIGNFVRGDTTLILIAKEILKKYPGTNIAYSLNCSRAVPEKIKEMNGNPIRAAVGYVNVTTAARQAGGAMGGELTGHYSYKDNYYADSGYVSFLLVLQALSESGKKMSELVSELNPYFPSEEINFKMDREKILGLLQNLKEKYKDGKQNELDGLTVEYDSWWFLVRASNTEPLIRLNIEADSKELLEEKTKELTDFLASF